MGKIIWIVVIATSIWVLGDAQKIGVKRGQMRGLADMGPWGWFFACLLFWVIGFPSYLVKRSEYKRINNFDRIMDFSTENIRNGIIYTPPLVNTVPSRQQILTDYVKKAGGFVAIAGMFVLIGIILMGIYYREYQTVSQRATSALRSAVQRATGIKTGKGQERIALEGYFACTNREFFKELISLSLKKDGLFEQRLASGMLTGDCIMLKAGEEIFITDTEILTGLINVRRMGSPTQYWTKNAAAK